MSGDSAGICWSCGAALAALDYGRETRCPGCGRATRCCRNCRWFDISASEQCREPMAEPVKEKQQANFCDWFEPGRPVADDQPGAEALRKAAEDLFRF